MINQINQEGIMKDLDQSDVNADAARMYGEEMDNLGNELDPGDVFSILRMIHDADDPAQDFDEFLRTSQVAGDIIKFTQGRPDKAHEVLVRMAELDDAIANL